MKKCAFCWFLLRMYIIMHGSKKRKVSTRVCLTLVNLASDVPYAVTLRNPVFCSHNFI